MIGFGDFHDIAPVERLVAGAERAVARFDLGREVHLDHPRLPARATLAVDLHLGEVGKSKAPCLFHRTRSGIA